MSAVLTTDEVAAMLSADEGRPVSRQEVLKIEAIAMRKLRRVLNQRNLRADDLLLDDRDLHQVRGEKVW